MLSICTANNNRPKRARFPRFYLRYFVFFLFYIFAAQAPLCEIRKLHQTRTVAQSHKTLTAGNCLIAFKHEANLIYFLVRDIYIRVQRGSKIGSRDMGHALKPQLHKK